MGEREFGPVTPEEVDARLERFALRVLTASRGLLANLESRDIALQLRRAATGAHSNHGAADAARSHADFTSKIGIAYEEAAESLRWLKLLKAAGMLRDESTVDLIREAGELRAMLRAAHRTAKQNRDYYRRGGSKPRESATTN